MDVLLPRPLPFDSLICTSTAHSRSNRTFSGVYFFALGMGLGKLLLTGVLKRDGAWEVEREEARIYEGCFFLVWCPFPNPHLPAPSTACPAAQRCPTAVP